MSRPKKPKLDFGAMVSGCKTVTTNAQLIQQKAKEFTAAVSTSSATAALLYRACEICNPETVELILVCRLGLEGVDSLRSAMQAVPEPFLGKRVSFVTNIVNSVLRKSNKECISDEECEIFMLLFSGKCKLYSQRKAHHLAYVDELTELTATSGKGYVGFLGPPVVRCLNVSCEERKLATYYDSTNVTLFTMDGPRPASKIALKCPQCSTSYGYSTYGNKLLSGVRYYNQERNFVEASDVVYIDRKLYQVFASLSMHCWVSFCGFTEVMFECWHTDKNWKLTTMMKEKKFCTQMTRKHVSTAFFNAELESELGETLLKPVTFFKSDGDKNDVMTKIETSRTTKPYGHTQFPSCTKNGCGSCWSFDGNWKLGFTHCMYPVKTTVQGLSRLNFPDICTTEPQYCMAFCKHHCDVAKSNGIPTDLKKYIQYQATPGSGEPPQEEKKLDHHPVAVAQGTESFMKANPDVIRLCDTVSNTTMCNKDTGQGSKLRMWSRGHFFIVRPCGHIDQWHPIYKSESPSQAFIIILTWLLQTLKDIPASKWEEIVVSYDNMCHLDGMRVAQEPLPLPPPYDSMWKSVTKVIDDLHIKNHRDAKCQVLYNPKLVKEKHPHYNLMCAEQVFTWLSRFKRITCAMNKTHHCFFLHRIVTKQNKYTKICAKLNRTPLLPSSAQ